MYTMLGGQNFAGNTPSCGPVVWFFTHRAWLEDMRRREELSGGHNGGGRMRGAFD